MPTETGFMSERDLINVVPRKRPPLRSMVERTGIFRLGALFRFNVCKAARIVVSFSIDTQKASDEMHGKNVVTYSDSRIDTFVHALQLAIGVGMLIGPLWILNSVNSTAIRLSTISCCIVVFLTAVSVLTSSSVPEALAATAA